MTRRRIADAAAIAVAVVTVFPIYWMVLSALKPTGEIRSADPRPWTLHPTLEHFSSALGVSGFGRYFLNSAVVALTVVALSALISFLAAVALTRYRFRTRTTLLVLFLVAQMVPVEALSIPLFFQIRDLGRTVPGVGLNTLGSLVLVQLAFSLPFAIWMLRGFVAAVPQEIEEAATLDGAGRFTILWRILFPLVAPGLAATGVFSFITAWNDFLFARTFIISTTENQTLPAALLVFFKPDENDWGGIMAASTLMTIPVLVFFVFVRHRLVSGLGGAVKD
ncbi:N,N'-diacetylchitobiose transport system permease protein [Micromonospora pisi]|uniref:N,N'-diacetylchitobiose transport system permease protein n=1 Tax=Micromonospora pisi TaxID=589240 RepID=A0A495JAJ6_9ACTN|nr:carbohydrate ABC transporter permease [Micromonospora pisi]RKR85935.1 N,N'-diacetylchitobiose transport system permease protein [Micromonospora pisi]